MKKYIAMIVCAILSLTALVLPIGTNARSNGKGNGSSAAVQDASQLSSLLQNADNGGAATYSYSYSEGLNIDRFSLNIVNAQMNVEQGSTGNEFDAKEGYINVFTSAVHPETDLPYSVRVDNLHISDTNSKGKFASDFDFVTFADIDMNTGMVKVEYQADDGSWYDGDAYCSGSDLGLDLQEATANINVYEDATSTNVEFTIKKGQLFVFIAQEGNKTHIKYSQGNGFVDGYISSDKYISAYVMVKHNDSVNDILVKKWNELANTDPDRATYRNSLWGIFETKYLNVKDAEAIRIKTARQATIIRYYETINHTVDGTFVRAAKVGYFDNSNNLQVGYMDATELIKLETTRLNKADTINTHEGSAKMYVSSNAVYTTFAFHSTIATGSIAKRSYVDAEIYVSATASLIKFNSLIFQDESLTSTQEDLDFVAALPIREWMTMEDAKIYLNAQDAANATYVNPLNELIASQIDENGCIIWVNFLSSINTEQSMVANGKSYSLKNDYVLDLNDFYYTIVNGSDYEAFKPSEDTDNTRTATLNFDLSNAKNPIIKSSYNYSVPVGDIFLGNTSCFESASERKVEISNVGNTIVPKTVMAEINAFSRG